MSFWEAESGKCQAGKVSVVLYTANERDMLMQTMKNLLRQNYADMEIIIVDDVSDDGSLERIGEIYGEVDGLIYVYNDIRMGFSASCNEGINHATGEYVAFARSGDLWDENRLLWQTDCLRQGGTWGYCHVRTDRREKPKRSWFFLQHQELLLPVLYLEDEISLYSVLVRKECLENIGGFDENLSELQGYDLILRLAAQDTGQYLPETLVRSEPKAIQLESLMLSEVYLMKKFAGQLGKYGLKKQKVIQTLDKAGFLTQMENLWKYADYILEDADYCQGMSEYMQKHNLIRHMTVCEKDTIEGIRFCIGCGVCSQICPVNAIHMEPDAGGFSVPKIDREKCIHCGKCVSGCPTQIDFRAEFRKQRCYAVQAKEEYLLEGSSGGVFPALAELVVSQGGYVAGAVFAEDFTVRHVVSNSRDDIRRMYGSKYVQSDLMGIYREIRELLEAGKAVLFTGCACQVAALKAYLGRDYETLYSADVVCHGVPSPGIWQERVRDFHAKYGDIREIRFRDKRHLGWRSGLYVECSDGREYTGSDDIYMKSFSNNWILRDCCYSCEFKAEAYSDLTLGDFWGINVLEKEFGEKGASCVIINTGRGRKLYRQLAGMLEREQVFPAKEAALFNPCMERPVEDNRMHHLLMQKIGEGMDLRQACEEAYTGLHFNIAMVSLWGSNYGNAITNYALYHTLEKRGSVIAVDTGVSRPRDKFLAFAKAHYLMASELFPYGEFGKLAEHSDTFLVGSDQVWNYSYTMESDWGYYFQLGFVGENRKKISYASSFGMRGLEPPREEYGEYYRKFSAVSVREESGIRGCLSNYGVEAVQVLDPVFLLKAEEYEDLLPEQPMEEEPYVLAYLLSPLIEKREYCERLSRELGNMKIIYIIDNFQGGRNLYHYILQSDNVKVELAVEEWLSYLHDAQYIVTDSFHGTCFALIFQKRFVSFVNRETDRFDFFKKVPGLNGRIMQVTANEELPLADKEVDYKSVGRFLDVERERSLSWLDAALQG